MKTARSVWVAVILVGAIVSFISPYLLPLPESGDRFAIALARGLLMAAALGLTWSLATRLVRPRPHE